MELCKTSVMTCPFMEVKYLLYVFAWVGVTGMGVGRVKGVTDGTCRICLKD